MHGEGVLVVRLALAFGYRLLLRCLHREPMVPLVRFDGFHCTGDECSAPPRTVECYPLGFLSVSS